MAQPFPAGVRVATSALLLSLAACGPAAGPPDAAPAMELAEPWFEEGASAAGVDFTWSSGHGDGRHLMPEIMGGGAALLDLEDDGDLDLYLVQGGDARGRGAAADAANRLYRNDGEGRFEDVSAGSGAEDRGYGMGVACADIEGDGDTDLYVTNVGPNALLLNDGRGRFEDATPSAGVGDPGWGCSAAFLDHDRDGDLDLYVTNYLEWSASRELPCYNLFGSPDYCNPANYEQPARDVLYENLGDGRFADVSERSGVASRAATGLGVGPGDFDDDGWIDLFVANDGMADLLWRNHGDGTFEDVAPKLGCALDLDGTKKAGMGVALGDLDDDGDLDLMVCNLNRQTDSLYVNEGDWFDDRTAQSGLALASRPFTRFGMGWIDFDHDGRLDLYQANGRVNQHSEALAPDVYAEPNLLFRGLGAVRFEEVLPRGGTRPELVATSRAAAFGDLDGDGDVDVLVVNRDARAQLLWNRAPKSGHWIRLRVRERSGGDALGATVRASVGGRRVRRDVLAAYGYLTSHDPRVHLGLGPVSQIEDVVVQWTDGGLEAFGSLPAGREHLLRRGAGSPAGEPPGTSGRD